MTQKWAAAILILAGIVAYGNTAKNGLFWDDDEFITKNAYVKSFGYIGQWFTRPLTYGAGVMSNYYRPLLLASFAVDYKLWGAWPAGYHLENMLWHTLAGILLFIFLLTLFSKKDSPCDARTVLNIAFATALLWLVHPVHVEAVAYANSRGDSMAAVFILLTLILWMKKRFWASAATFLAALLSKEFAIVTPGLIALIEFMKAWPSSGRPGLFKLSVGFAPHLIITVVYLLLRLTVLNFQNTLNFYGVDLTKADQTQPLVQYATSLPVRLLTFLKVLPIYAKILVWPDDLHMERTVEIPATILDPSILFSLSFISILAGFFGWTLIFSKRKLAGTSEPRSHALREHPASSCAAVGGWREGSVLWGFAVGWFFISILPVSGIIPISQILAEHFLYLPSMGFFVILSLVIVYLASLSFRAERSGVEKSSEAILNRMIFFIVIILTAPLLLKTIRQNRIWRDPITFYEYTLSRAEPTARVYNNLAMAYADQDEHQKAINNYQLAIGLSDVYPNPHYNLGNTYRDMGEGEKAELEYKRALQIDPNFHFARLTLGQMYLDKGKIEEAIKLVCPVFPTQPLCL